MASEEKATAAGGIPAPEGTRDATSNVDADNNPQNGDGASLDSDVRDEKAALGATKFQKIKAHIWRFRWWYLLGLVIFLAILLPIL